ncbi:hypothetical protein Agub_g6883, partial [Astrephomene gubernaculifera]
RGRAEAAGGVEKANLPSSIKLESLGVVEEVLYATSGCLYNLSRHPGNRDTLYRLHLEGATRGAVADLAAEAAENPPKIPGLSTHEAAVVLLSGGNVRIEGSHLASASMSGSSRCAGASGGGGSSGRRSPGDGAEDEDEDDENGGGGSASGSAVSASVPYYMRHEV